MPESCEMFIEWALAEVLNTVAFIDPMPPEDLTGPTEASLLTRIEFRGATNGALALVCTERFGTVLSENLFGISPDEAEGAQRAADALRELLNITCGTMLRAWGTAHWGGVEMGVPTQEAFEVSEWSAFVAGGATVLDADGNKVAIRHFELV